MEAAGASCSGGGEMKCNDWPLLTAAECEARMEAVMAWELKAGEILKLEREFTCVNFQAALDFITAAGAVAEARNHHPDFHLTGYRNIKIVVFTHGLSGLTDNDFNLCKAIDSAKIKYSPKFLKENPKVAYTALG